MLEVAITGLDHYRYCMTTSLQFREIIRVQKIIQAPSQNIELSVRRSRLRRDIRALIEQLLQGYAFVFGK
jgi:hypothetical protein